MKMGVEVNIRDVETFKQLVRLLMIVLRDTKDKDTRAIITDKLTEIMAGDILRPVDIDPTSVEELIKELSKRTNIFVVNVKESDIVHILVQRSGIAMAQPIHTQRGPITILVKSEVK